MLRGFSMLQRMKSSGLQSFNAPLCCQCGAYARVVWMPSTLKAEAIDINLVSAKIGNETHSRHSNDIRYTPHFHPDAQYFPRASRTELWTPAIDHKAQGASKVPKNGKSSRQQNHEEETLCKLNSRDELGVLWTFEVLQILQKPDKRSVVQVSTLS